MGSEGGYAVTCQHCREVVLTGRQIAALEVAKLTLHLRERHPELLDRHGGPRDMDALLRSFSTEWKTP